MKKLAIVGSAPRSSQLAPFDNPEYEIWGLNYGYNFMPRFTRYFELHDLSKLNPQHTENLKSIEQPVYLQEIKEGFKQPLLYPLQEVIDKTGCNYFTNSISYMIALAIVEGFEIIDIYGVDMAVNQEYREQRPSCEYWIGYARGLGIKVTLPPSSDLLKTSKLYAFNTETEEAKGLIDGRKEELITRLSRISQELNAISNNYQKVMTEKTIEQAAVQGALEELIYSHQRGPNND